MGAPKFLGVGSALLALVLVLHFMSYSVECQIILMRQSELQALQQLWNAWNTTTDPESNLAGWQTLEVNGSITYQGFAEGDDPCYGRPWHGLLCVQTLLDEADINNTNTNVQYNATQSYYRAVIVGLILNYASITGQLPPNVIGYFPQLDLLELTGNPGLTGPIPSLASSNGLSLLRVIDIHNNGFNGNVDWEGVYFALQSLDLSYNKLSGETLRSGMLAPVTPSLRTLTLSHNNFSGPICHWFSPGISYSDPILDLVMVDLSSNIFSGPFCNLTNATSLYTLNVSHNLLSGEINPASFIASGMPHLKVLDLSHNKFNGTLPNLGFLANITTLGLSWNNFEPGPFPEWVVHLEGLEFLDLSGTSLTGEFSLDVFNNLTKLQILLLDNNDITGTLNIESIYDTLRNMNRSMQLVSIRNNDITDVIFDSTSVNDLGNWVTINLNGNPYCNIPTIGSDLQHCVCEGYCVDSS